MNMAQAHLTISKTMIFHQYEKDGSMQFRTRFGRNKALVFRQHVKSGYFHVDLYNNNPGNPSYTGISLGLDELDALIKIRHSFEALKSDISKQKSPTSLEITSQSYMHRNPTIPPYAYQQSASRQLKRPAAATTGSGEEENIPKLPRYETISPAPQTEDVPAELYDDFFVPMQ